MSSTVHPGLDFDVCRLLSEMEVTFFPYVSFPPLVISAPSQVDATGETLRAGVQRGAPTQFNDEKLEKTVRGRGASTSNASTCTKNRGWGQGQFAGECDELIGEGAGATEAAAVSDHVYQSSSAQRNEMPFGKSGPSWSESTARSAPEGRSAGGGAGKTQAITIYEEVPSTALLAMMERLNARNDAIRRVRGASESRPRHFEEKRSR